MNDDESKRGLWDTKRINVQDDRELRHWSTNLGVSPDKLKRAVQKVGVLVNDVRRELNAH